MSFIPEITPHSVRAISNNHINKPDALLGPMHYEIQILHTVQKKLFYYLNINFTFLMSLYEIDLYTSETGLRQRYFCLVEVVN